MTTRSQAYGTKIDWDFVDRQTEVPRTYLVVNREGRSFFKMYKPSEANERLRKKDWKGKIISQLRLK